MNTKTTTVKLDCVYGEGPTINGVIVKTTDANGIEICFDCCQTVVGDPGMVWIENKNGIPYIHVWADPDEEDPSHSISLERVLSIHTEDQAETTGGEA